MAKQLGFSIPFFAKARARSRLRKLENRAEKLKVKFDELTKDIAAEKERAGDVLTHKDFGNRARALDDKISEFCDAGEGFEDSEGVSRGRRGPGKTEIEKQCKKKAAQKMGWQSARGKKGHELDAWKILVKKCKDQGGELSGCKL